MHKTFHEIKAYGELIKGLPNRFDESSLDEMIQKFVYDHYEESHIGAEDDLDLIRDKFVKYIKEYERFHRKAQ